jgi:hypothetical protein
VSRDESSYELHYVVRTVAGARHAGWYRLLDEHRLQVMSEGRSVTVPAAPGSLEDQARDLLKEMAGGATPDQEAQPPPRDDVERNAPPK